MKIKVYKYNKIYIVSNFLIYIYTYKYGNYILYKKQKIFSRAIYSLYKI